MLTTRYSLQEPKMELHLADVQNLAAIDRELGDCTLPPAQLEIIRQVIYQTGDFEYLSLLRFSSGCLNKAATALAARRNIIVDIPAIQVSIVPQLQKTLFNPVYCCQTTSTRPQKRLTRAAWGLEKLAPQHSEEIFVIGQDRSALTSLVELLERKVVRPSLIIATPPTFGEEKIETWLTNSAVPHIYVEGCKGGAAIATAILNTLVKLTWRAYQYS